MSVVLVDWFLEQELNQRNTKDFCIVRPKKWIGKTKIKLGKNVKIEFIKDRPGHDVRYALNSNKLIHELKWKPKTNFKQLVKEMVTGERPADSNTASTYLQQIQKILEEIKEVVERG